MKTFKIFVLSTLFLLFNAATSYCQLTVNPNQTAVVLASKLTGGGITISSPVLTCPGVANGTFKSVTTPINIDSGIVLTSGKAINTIGVESTLASFNNGAAGDAALTAFAGTATHDACVLEFDFIPNGDTVSFNYQFGSEEYNNSNCGQYNDDFAFFISGPGIVGTVNMALVPGTNIPVTVNSINNGIPGPPGYPGYCNIANCTSMGPGSPFISYYVDNTGGTQLTYKGFTTKLKAQHDVIPCNTYHLKMAVADAANFLYDSGVFIEAGSLKTNSYSFSTLDSAGHTINGIPHTLVKGCASTDITIISGRPVGVPHTLSVSFGGTAVPGVDFSCPTAPIMLAGDTITVITVSALATPATGPKTLTIYLQSPFSCAMGGIVDSVKMNIIDSPTARILTPDTTVCFGSTFTIHATGTTGLNYNWTPSTGLGTTTVMQPTSTPSSSATYNMTATLPLAGCPPISRSIHIIVDTININILTPDTSVCIGTPVRIMTDGLPGITYNWAPATGLNNPTIQNPIANPAVTTTYTLTAVTSAGCIAKSDITVTIIAPVITMTTPDTSICVGATAYLAVNGDPTYIYNWTSANGLNDATIMNPAATPAVNTTYTVTATVPGTTCTTTAHVSIFYLPQVIATASGGKSVCVSDPIQLYGAPAGENYHYQWTGPAGFTSHFQDPFVKNAHPDHEGIYTLTVTDNTTTCSGTDTTFVKVGLASATLTNVTPSQTIAYGSSIHLNAENAMHFRWTPNDGTLDNPNISNPFATPLTKTTYVVYAHNNDGCPDTASVTIDVSFDPVIFIPSAFTPNGDGKNDVFHVGNLGSNKLVEMSVFSRWGEVIYHSLGSNEGWNGLYNGVLQEMGTYNYFIIIGKQDGSLEPYKGTVTLIR